MCRLKLLFFPNNIGNKINDLVYKRFKNQLKRDKDGWYETGLLWKQEQNPRYKTTKMDGKQECIIQITERCKIVQSA